MSGRDSLTRELPLGTLQEVTDWCRSGRYTLDKMAELLKARGYKVSRSALGRFAKKTAGTEGILLAWARNNPEQAAVLARMIAANPNGGFTLYIRAAKRKANHE